MSRPSQNDANREDRPPGYDYLPTWAAAVECKRCASIQHPCDGHANCFCRKCLVCWVERARNLPHSIRQCTTRRERFNERYIDANHDWKYHAPDGTTHLYIPRAIREQINQSYQRHVERSQSRSSVSVPHSRTSHQRDSAKRQRSSQRSSPQRSGQPFQPRDRVQPNPLCVPPAEPKVPPVVNIIAHSCCHCNLNERRRRLLADTTLSPKLISIYMESPHFSDPSLHRKLLQARSVREQYRLRHPEATGGPPYFVLSHILYGQPDEQKVSTRCMPSPSRAFAERIRQQPNIPVQGQGGRIVIAPPHIRRTNSFLLLPAITKILGMILGFACATDAELMRLRTVSVQFYYLPFQMPYGLNALRGMTDLLAGLALKPHSAKQEQQGTGDADLFKQFATRVSNQQLPSRHRVDNFLNERQALAAISRLRRVLCNISGAQMNAINREIFITQDYLEMIGTVIAETILQTPETLCPNMDFTWQDRRYIRPRRTSNRNVKWDVRLASKKDLWQPRAHDSELAFAQYSSFPPDTKMEPIDSLLEPHIRALGMAPRRYDINDRYIADPPLTGVFKLLQDSYKKTYYAEQVGWAMHKGGTYDITTTFRANLDRSRMMLSNRIQSAIAYCEQAAMNFRTVHQSRVANASLEDVMAKGLVRYFSLYGMLGHLSITGMEDCLRDCCENGCVCPPFNITPSANVTHPDRITDNETLFDDPPYRYWAAAMTAPEFATLCQQPPQTDILPVYPNYLDLPVNHAMWDVAADQMTRAQARLAQVAADTLERKQSNNPAQVYNRLYERVRTARLLNRSQLHTNIYTHCAPREGWCNEQPLDRAACSLRSCATFLLSWQYNASDFEKYGPHFDLDRQIGVTPTMSCLQCFINADLFGLQVFSHLTRLATVALMYFGDSQRTEEFQLDRFQTLLSFANRVMLWESAGTLLTRIRNRYVAPNARLCGILLGHLHLLQFCMAHIHWLGGDTTSLRTSFAMWAIFFQSVCLMRSIGVKEKGVFKRQEPPECKYVATEEGTFKRNALLTGYPRIFRSLCLFETMLPHERDAGILLTSTLMPLMKLAGHQLYEMTNFQRLTEMGDVMWTEVRNGGANYVEYLRLAMQGRDLLTTPYVWSLQNVGTKVNHSAMSQLSSYGATEEQCSHHLPFPPRRTQTLPSQPRDSRSRPSEPLLRR